MRRLTLDPSTLRVETFDAGIVAGAGLVPIIVGTGDSPSYPDCPTATGCTCVAACQSIVEPDCPPPATGTEDAE